MKPTLLTHTQSKYLAVIVTSALFLLVTLFATKPFAKPNDQIGPKLGKPAPTISVIDTKKETKTIKQLSGENGLIILFFRSADWCPFCKKHLIELNNHSSDFTKLGYGLAAISYDNVSILEKFAQQQNISYPLLSDQKVATMKSYNIVNNDYSVGDDNYGIPYPGVVVIDKAGNISQKHFFEGYRNRVKFSELYDKLKTEKQ